MSQTLSKTAQRRTQVASIADEIERVAIDAGWRLKCRESFSGGVSIYLRLKLKNQVNVVVRISDHTPCRPFGLCGDTPTFAVFPGVLGCVETTNRWLVKTASEVQRIMVTHKITLPAARGVAV